MGEQHPDSIFETNNPNSNWEGAALQRLLQVERRQSYGMRRPAVPSSALHGVGREDRGGEHLGGLLALDNSPEREWKGVSLSVRESGPHQFI
jgi:hypothetical protein